MDWFEKAIDGLKAQWEHVKAFRSIFIVSLLFCTCAVGAGIVWFEEKHYESEVRAKDAKIALVEAERDRYRNQLQDAGVISSPLKKRALILARDLENFAKNWPQDSFPQDVFWKFNNRFEERINKIVTELDEQGSHSPDFEHDAKFMQEFGNPGEFNVGKVYRLAKTIKDLANGLKDDF